MKKHIAENNAVVYVHEYKGYTITFTTKEDKFTALLIMKDDNYVLSGDIHDEKNPQGLPNTTHYRNKLKNEVEKLLDESFFNSEE